MAASAAPDLRSAVRGASWFASWTALRRFGAALVQPQVSSAARERRDVFVLLFAIAFVVAPLFEHLPVWATATFSGLWMWRFWLNATQRPLPGHLAILPLLIAAVTAVWLQHRTLLGRDAGVNFLLLLMALKLLELRARRDLFVVIFLALFLLLTQFLFDQSLVVALLMVAAVLLLFAVLVSVNLKDSDLSAGRKLKLVGIIALKAVPLAVILFLLFPRLSEPLWRLPGDSASATTGLSNSMSPGTISRLLESNEIAFRARFEGEPPANNRLYWRGPVFGFFNGRTWSPLSTRSVPPPPFALQADPATAVTYTVTLEVSQRDWLFALDLPLSAPADSDLNPRVNPEGQLLASSLVRQRSRYEARSYTRYAFGLNENEASLRDWLALPATYNPRAAQFAADLRSKTSGDAGALVTAVLQHFRGGGYVYTLRPPLLGRNSIDEFLFETRQGYCEHYSSAFVVLMRLLGVPARVVTGYQGGEINPVDGFMTVRQSDAHAWAEVWLPARGWVRVDPTSVVAPVRIEEGAIEIARQAGIGGAISGAVGGLSEWMRFVRAVRFNWEAVQNSWNQWVLTYSSERQRALLTWMGFEPDGTTLAILLSLALTIALAVLAFFSLRHRTERDPLSLVFERFRARLLDAGIRVDPSLGPRALQAQIERELAAENRHDARTILGEIERWRYSRASHSVPRAQVRALQSAVRRFRPRAA